MASRSLCGAVTYQVAVAILASVFFLVAFLVFGVNVFSYENNRRNEWPIDIVVVVCFVALMTLTGTLLFVTAYLGSRKLCFVTMVDIAVVAAYWVVLTIFSFVNNPVDVRRVCVEHRCGESFWLASLRYRCQPHPYADILFTVEELPLLKSLLPPQRETPASTLKQSEKTITTQTDESKSETKRSSESSSKTITSKENSKSNFSNANLQISSSNQNEDINTSSKHNTNETLLHSSSLKEYEIPRRKQKRSNEGLLFDSDYDYHFEYNYNTDQPGFFTLEPFEYPDYLITPGPSEDDEDDVNVETDENDKNYNDIESCYNFNVPFAGAIVFAVVNLCFFLFSIAVVWNYVREL